MWRWNPLSRAWTLLNGTTTTYVAGVYPSSVGGLGIAGSRNFHTMVIDPQTDLIYVFGGQGWDAAKTCKSGVIYYYWVLTDCPR